MGLRGAKWAKGLRGRAGRRVLGWSSGCTVHEQARPCTGSCHFSYCITKASAFDYVSCPLYPI